MVCCLIVTMLLSWQKEASKSCEEIGPLYCSMPDNIWQHKDKSSLRKIRLLCALEEAERRGNRSRPQPSETWSVLSNFAPTADTQYEALCGLGAEQGRQITALRGCRIGSFKGRENLFLTAVRVNKEQKITCDYLVVLCKRGNTTGNNNAPYLPQLCLPKKHTHKVVMTAQQ